jgi:hypothetical protein
VAVRLKAAAAFAATTALLCGCDQNTIGDRPTPSPSPSTQLEATERAVSRMVELPHFPPHWRGSRHVKPRAYRWLNGAVPIDTYGVTTVRGLTVRQVLETLGGVQNRERAMTHRDAENLASSLMGRRTSGPVVQIAAAAGAVFVYQPLGFRAWPRTGQLSRDGIAATFITTVEWDTYVSVARRGDILRKFDIFGYYRGDRAGALPEERGLGIGSRGQNPFASAWAYLERLTLVHIDRDWFMRGRHHTYVLNPRRR